MNLHEIECIVEVERIAVVGVVVVDDELRWMGVSLSLSLKKTGGLLGDKSCLVLVANMSFLGEGSCFVEVNSYFLGLEQMV